MYNPDDPVGNVNGDHGEAVCRHRRSRVIREMGQEKGEAVVKRAVRRFANMRAQKIIENIKKDGKEVTFHTVEEYSDYPANRGVGLRLFRGGEYTERDQPRLSVFHGLP